MKAGTIMCDATGRFHMYRVHDNGEEEVSEESFATEKGAEDYLKQWIEQQGYDAFPLN